MEMTPKEISEQLIAVQAALVDKLGAQPWAGISMNIRQSGTCAIPVYGDWDNYSTDVIGIAEGKTFAAAFKEAHRIIAEIPDADTAAKRKFHKNLADVIDEGNGLNLPSEVMAPLNNSMKAMSENLLTYQPGASE